MIQCFATPLIGGCTLGLLAVGRLLLYGEVLGISGHLRSTVTGIFKKSQLMHTVGLVLGGLLMTAYAPDALENLPKTYTYARAGIAGILIGAGAALGGGCTSGHGICGNARLAPRSILFTLIIIGSGVVSARFAGTAESLQLHTISYPATRNNSLLTGAGLLATSLIVLGMTYLAMNRVKTGDAHWSNPLSKSGQVGSAIKQYKSAQLISDTFQGILFAFALGFTGMSKPSNVVAFLSIGTAVFDPRLLAVMGGAVFLAMPIFLRVSRGSPSKAVSGCNFPEQQKAVTKKLLLGGVLFGAGWGVGGLCPGPAMVSIATGSPQVLVFTSSMLLGLGCTP